MKSVPIERKWTQADQDQWVANWRSGKTLALADQVAARLDEGPCRKHVQESQDDCDVCVREFERLHSVFLSALMSS